MDDWSLVRTQDGKVGWVLTRALSMAIPDEVAQYAEGHRITSYFALGHIEDGDSVKNNWLWTTITKGRSRTNLIAFACSSGAANIIATRRLTSSATSWGIFRWKWTTPAPCRVSL